MRVNRVYSRGFLMAASAYRRHARGFAGDYSERALKEQYEHETLGREVSETNGFAVGKKFLDVTLKAQRQDFAEGLFTKRELLEGASAFVRKQIRLWLPVEFFARAI